MKKKYILVTGAAGFLGRNVSKHFSERGWHVTGIGLGDWNDEDCEEWGIKEWYPSKVTMSSLSKIQNTPDLIVHCAGSGSVRYSIEYPKEDFEANVLTLLTVLEYMRLGAPMVKLIYPSSAAVYGEKGDYSIKEEDLLLPVSPYGFHKLIAEKLCESYSKSYNLNISIIRFFSLYGVGLKKQLLWDACEKIHNSDRQIVFYGSGNETRDFLNIRDAASLIYKLTEVNEKFQVINGGSGNSMQVKELLNSLIRLYGKKVQLVFTGSTKNGDPGHYCADITKARSLGWKPEIKMDDGLREYVEYYKKL